jgi:hypothetical protein
VVLTATISILCEEGWISRSAIGEEPLDSKGYGGPAKIAASETFRRAASKYGLGLHLYYDKD